MHPHPSHGKCIKEMGAVELSWIQPLYCLLDIAIITLVNPSELDLLIDTVEDRYFRIRKDSKQNQISSTSQSQVRKIAQIIKHPDLEYQEIDGKAYNDYVIFKLDIPFIFNDDVQSACLPPSKEYLGLGSSEEQCFTSGWGRTQSGSFQKPDVCQYVRIPTVSTAVCKSFYGSSITDAMICGGYIGVGEKSPCSGDSGGPFVCNNGGKAVIAGVVSWGPRVCELPVPHAYARVTHVLDWIKSHMVSYSQ